MKHDTELLFFIRILYGIALLSPKNIVAIHMFYFRTKFLVQFVTMETDNCDLHNFQWANSASFCATRKQVHWYSINYETKSKIMVSICLWGSTFCDQNVTVFVQNWRSDI